jgi:TetR/AcrR family fatty acid metabolism transcriptional regulator
LRERYVREVVEPTMKIGEEKFRAGVEQGKVTATDVPLAMRAVAGAVLGLLVLGLLGDEEVSARWDEAAGVPSGLLIHDLESTGGDRHA